MKNTKFEGTTHLYLEDGKVRVALSGGVLHEPARLSTSADNAVGKALIRQMRHSAVAGLIGSDYAKESSVAVTDSGVFIDCAEWALTLTPLARTVSIDIAFRDETPLHKTGAFWVAAKALANLGWDKLSRIYASPDLQELELVMNPSLVPGMDGTYSIPGIKPKLRYVPALQSLMMQTETIENAITARNVIDVLGGYSEHSMDLIVIATALSQEDRRELLDLESVTLIEQSANEVRISTSEQSFSASWKRSGDRIILTSGVVRRSDSRRKVLTHQMSPWIHLLNETSRARSANGGGVRYYGQEQTPSKSATSAELTEQALLAHRPMPLTELNEAFGDHPHYAQVLVSLLASGALVITDGVVQLG